MRRSYGKRKRFSGGARPALSWASLSSAWSQSVAVTTATPLISLEMPATLVGVTSDPPEDISLLRVVGQFGTNVSAPASWTLALLVQDATWTPSTAFATDADKRVLWHRTYETGEAAGASWGAAAVGAGAGTSGRIVSAAATTECPERYEHVDISPKARVEPGQALYLVAYENANGATFSTTTRDMRVLFTRSRRRSR